MMDIKYWIIFLPAISFMQAFSQPQIIAKNVRVMQLTHDPNGHTIHNTKCFSPDDQWIVYDGRNYDSLISSTGNISMVNVETGEIRELYHTTHQTQYGPGVGAATFSPAANRVIFIHGIRNSDKKNPYDFTRRTGVAIDVAKPLHPIFMDARDITPPFTPGALRGGTHAHNWSADGKWISFTYNDYILQQLEKKDSSVKDLRTVGIMVPGHPVHVAEDPLLENNNGKMFAVVVAEVTENPKPGSDEIDRAFDEGWIGSKGYQKKDGKWQHRAIAFQGEVVNDDGSKKSEVFVADLPEDVTKAKPGKPLEGGIASRPNVPAGVEQRRITYTSNGIQGPRHWLRSTPDGSLIAFLSKDDKGIVQLFGVSPNGGNIKQLSFNNSSIQGPFNFSPDGKYLAYLADNSVFVTELSTGKSQRLTPPISNQEKLTGSVVWSNDGFMLAFNKYVKDKTTGKLFLQIFVIKLNSLKR
jgi:Tol biopolymer transport system component